MKLTCVDRLKQKARKLKAEIYVLSQAFKDPRTPWYVKAFIVLIIAYALSPVDLIPDFIPVLGYIDDLLLVPAGIYLAIKMVPGEVVEEYRQNIETEIVAGKSRWVAATLIILFWLVVLYLIIKLIWF
jgi:uncharacterized membrane protein YkvA (DUF1232 family)